MMAAGERDRSAAMLAPSATAASRRRWLSWLLTAPLMAAGSVAAHSIGALLVGARLSVSETAGAGEAAEGPARTAGHWWLLALGLVGAIVLVAVAQRLVVGRRGGVGAEADADAGRRLAGWLVLLPPLAFALQELAERLAHAESAPFSPALEPRLLVGLALQLPFAAAAFLLGRVLVRAAVAVARALAARRPVLPAPARRRFRPWPGSPRRRIPVLALGHAGRGPPGR